jgi:hypothetical protein
MVMALTRGPVRVMTSRPLACRMPACGVGAVDREGGLAVGSGLDQPVAVPVREELGEAAGGDGAAAVLERAGRHGEPDVVGQQGDEAVEVSGGVGGGELADQLLLRGGTGSWRLGGVVMDPHHGALPLAGGIVGRVHRDDRRPEVETGAPQVAAPT